MKLFKNLDKDKLLYGGLIVTFVILYGATAFVSWYHSITFFNIANAVWLSVLLSFVAEVGQASVLFSILLTENKNKILPWFIMIILTALQVIGNVVSSYQWIIDHNSAGVDSFQKSILFWIETGDPQMFKVIIAWISGSLLPIIALSMTALVAQNMKLRATQEKPMVSDDTTVNQPTPEETVDAKDLISEISKIRPSEEDLNTLERILLHKKNKEKDVETENDKTIYEVNELIDRINDTGNIPALSDEEIMEMNQDEYDRTNYLPEDEESIVEEKIIPKIEVISNNGLVQGIPVEKEMTGSEELHKEMEQIRNEMIEEENKILPQPTVTETVPPIVEPPKEQQIIKKKSAKT